MSGVPKANDFASMIRDIQSRIQRLERTSVLNSASIGHGGLKIQNNGNVTLLDGGNLLIKDGGDLVIYGGGSLKSRYSDSLGGKTAAVLGPLGGVAGGGVSYEQGFLLQDRTGTPVIWIAEMSDGTFNLAFGSANAGGAPAIDVFDVNSNGSARLISPDVRFGADLAAGDHVIIQHANVWLPVGMTTTGTAANLVYDPISGLLQAMVSSERYKQDIAPAVIDPKAVLALDPKTYRDKAEVAGDVPRYPLSPGEAEPDPLPPAPEARTYTGFIAEQADSLGLNQFVEYDAEGRPNSFSYASFAAVGHQVVLRQQQERIATLEATVAELVSRLDSIQK